MSAWFIVAVAAVSFIAGTAASVVGFGIGSLLTPLIAMRFGTEFAVAAVALPHLAGGLLRGWRFRRSIDRGVLFRFGLLSAAGGLLGALAFSRLGSDVLTGVLGVLLVLTATAGITGWSERWTPRGPLVWALGLLSGFCGGVAGNHGGLRAAALSAFGLSPTTFVATSAMVGVMVDLVRTPIYLHRVADGLLDMWSLIVVAIVGVVAGTLVGDRVLPGLSHERFRMVVSVAVGVLGVWFLASSIGL